MSLNEDDPIKKRDAQTENGRFMTPAMADLQLGDCARKYIALLKLKGGDSFELNPEQAYFEISDDKLAEYLEPPEVL